MKNRSLIAIAVLIAVAGVAAPFAFAQRRAMHAGAHGFDEPMMFGRLERARKVLDLSDEQVTQIRAIFTELRQQNAPYRDSIRSGFGSAFQALLANPNDVAGAQRALDQQDATERAMKANAITAFSKALNVLTPDQRAKLGTLVEKRMARRANR
jgi:Spy/CpxP family protein refolding chaperone